MSRPVIVVVGAGPGVSGSVARRFADEGYDVGLLGVDRQVLDDLTADLEGRGATVLPAQVDVTDTAAATAAVRAAGEAWGRIDVLHFNPSAYREKDPLELTVPELLEDVALGVGALLTAVQAARPFLAAGSRISVTGSMAADRPWHGAASLGVQKAGVRNLVRSLDDALAPEGIRAVSLTVRGTLAREGAFTPDRVADAIWRAVTTGEEEWASEVPYAG
ncbi:short-chain dehydrogenase [Nocardioides sp. Soil777]|uniref:SDR family oxidoreductase n=1 Tax=Nocardioides sp. Soil777 TaxID=1736409 RepID=UPI000702D306|nr:SDR family oxidoreductase [Nocardioides sp. Soil777]KRE99261.1 short-chain dehydrogenase [Nocardioides sp. Soil777]